ncbi:hypothetical protein PFLUV_G00003850 [Perca fluviatilis]|uniref:Ig-like domain-containing protein n=2 Tax=Perca fluviatilis TaxID=8168 RepID=A0A6A5FLP1_PERFL|nr:hypothetical protein PFLUV_G00003850 [Perca fluviatilis]
MKWYTVHRNGSKTVQKELSTDENRVTYNMSAESNFTLTVKDLRESDANDYCCGETTDDPELCWNNKTELRVAGLELRMDPAEVIEGQNVTLTCNTSCPLPNNPIYTWYLNSQPLDQPENLKKLKLDQFSSENAGNYSCAVNSRTSIIAFGDIPQTVNTELKKAAAEAASAAVAAAAAAGVCALLLAITLLVVFFWIRKQRASGQSPKEEATDNTEQLNPDPVYENILARPAEQEELHYSRVYFSRSQAEPLYSTVQPHQPNRQEHVAYYTSIE